jgi:hypothetical protein
MLGRVHKNGIKGCEASLVSRPYVAKGPDKHANCLLSAVTIQHCLATTLDRNLIAPARTQAPTHIHALDARPSLGVSLMVGTLLVMHSSSLQGCNRSLLAEALRFSVCAGQGIDQRNGSVG